MTEMYNGNDHPLNVVLMIWTQGSKFQTFIYIIL